MDLRRLRAATGRTIDDVARHLECSAAKVSRMETGAVRVGISDLRGVGWLIKRSKRTAVEEI